MTVEVEREIPMDNKTAYLYLSDVANFKNLMPDTLERFEVLDNEAFSFSLKGMPTITLKKQEAQPHNKLVFGAATGKLPFTLTASMHAVNDHSTRIGLSFQGQFNAMMAMMVKTPITNFMETLSKNLQQIA